MEIHQEDGEAEEEAIGSQRSSSGFIAALCGPYHHFL